MIKINEIFYSIQGESSLTGLPTIFIRTSGCHLRCNYCDTTYAYHDGKRISDEEIFKKISEYPCKRVCLTGGEPLLQKSIISLMGKLIAEGYSCSIETSGDLDCAPVPPEVLKVIDIKTPDSGEPDAFCLKNLHFVGDKNTEFKFVICSEADFDWSIDFAAKHHMFQNSKILFSPCHEQISTEWLAKKILDSGQKIRLQIQLHKVIWPTTIKGI
ncbi:MAG: radical SAM protein [Bdellovibrionales bacterium]